jgi:hypothetical protein
MPMLTSHHTSMTAHSLVIIVRTPPATLCFPLRAGGASRDHVRSLELRRP